MLRLNKVSAGYHGTSVLKDIDLQVHAGEILVFVGLNGSGKSTCLRTMLGLLRPSAGEIFLNGKALKEWKHRERAQFISLLESDNSPGFPISVSELLDLGALRRSEREHRDLRSSALNAVGLTGFEKRNVLQLSSGEAKRAFIAHTLCSGAQLIMMDEPFAHLDWNHQAELAGHLIEWRKSQGTTFVLAVHELEWAVKVADRICVLHEGRLLLIDTPDKVLTNDQVREVFAFQSRIDENPLDGSKRLTLSPVNKERALPIGSKK